MTTDEPKSLKRTGAPWQDEYSPGCQERTDIPVAKAEAQARVQESRLVKKAKTESSQSSVRFEVATDYGRYMVDEDRCTLGREERWQDHMDRNPDADSSCHSSQVEEHVQEHVQVEEHVQVKEHVQAEVEVNFEPGDWSELPPVPEAEKEDPQPKAKRSKAVWRARQRAQ